MARPKHAYVPDSDLLAATRSATTMNEFHSHTVDSGGVRLRVHELGSRDRAPLVLLHGMQDVARAMMPVAQRLAEEFWVLVPELRGHGDSDWPGTYSLLSYAYDLHQVLQAFDLSAPAVLGHSLGGQIAVRLAALVPASIGTLVIAEGLGPPAAPGEIGTQASMRADGVRFLATFGAVPRALPSLEFAAQRLQMNNPRLSTDRALWLADVATYRDDDGALHWAFDPRVRTVFIGPEDACRYWPHVTCPTLNVFGAHAHEYWRKTIARHTDWDGRFAKGELESRAGAFPRGEWTLFDNSGHMVHHDEPDRLADVAHAFCLQHQTLPEEESLHALSTHHGPLVEPR